ncbi:MAG: glycoside hydrolase domain-containing protein [Mycobacteriales bacterium]
MKRRALPVAVVAVLALVTNAPAATTGAAALASAAPGSYTGSGFDACTAPTPASMQAWSASPYRAIGIYIGGNNRACTQPQLTASWVSTQLAAGWHLLPVYLGLQAPCTTSSKPNLINPAAASSQGTAAANDAVAQAGALGLPTGTTIFNDMEAYRTGDSACRTAVLQFESAWTQRLHDLSYFSGFYSSLSSGVADQVAVYSSTSYVRPDYLWFARYDNVASTTDPSIPDSYWSPHRRIKQYAGSHSETWGSVTINVDNDFVDVAPLPPTPFGDFNGNGWSDIIARQVNGDLTLYVGNGTRFTAPRRIGVSWNGMDVIVRHGDFNRDGHEDVIAREKATGSLWLYYGTGSTLSGRTRIGIGWAGLREITAIGDLTGDGFPDIVAIQTSTGNLFLYAGHGTSLSAGVQIGSGWAGFDELTGVGDFTRDGPVDLIARQTATGDLYLYRGSTGALGNRSLVGAGWGAMRDLTGIGDFDRDGYPDLVTLQTTTGNLYLYPGRGTSFGTRSLVGTSWNSLRPLL